MTTVSVIIPTYRDTELLSRALASVRAQQTDATLQPIVVDSSRESVAIDTARQFAAAYRYQPPEGPAAARNAGIDAADGEYIAFLDADDEWLPPKTAEQLSALQASDAELAYADQIVYDGDSRQHKTAVDLDGDQHVQYFSRGQGIPSRTVLADAEVFESERFDESMQVREDPHLWTRLLAQFDAVRVDEPLAIKYRRDGTITDDTEKLLTYERREISSLCRQYPELRPHLDERLREAEFRALRKYLRAGNTAKARQQFARLLREHTPDYRIVATGIASLLPSPVAPRGLEALERGQELL